jgi:uncharacterized repeat protein (TIGR03803 family)
LTTLYSFCSQVLCPDGDQPTGALVQTNGDFYGTTSYGGAHGSYAGTVFKITPNGILTTLYSFCHIVGCADGRQPYAGLIQGTDGDFYGTTSVGGANSEGTVFEITPTGMLTTLHSFDGTDGGDPVAALVQDTNGMFYGTTVSGGGVGDGTVFSLSVALGPFVETDPISGNVGAAVNILGTDLTGATKVTFHGIAATFIAVSNSEITTTVPTGAIAQRRKRCSGAPCVWPEACGRSIRSGARRRCFV